MKRTQPASHLATNGDWRRAIWRRLYVAKSSRPPRFRRDMKRSVGIGENGVRQVDVCFDEGIANWRPGDGVEDPTLQRARTTTERDALRERRRRESGEEKPQGERGLVIAR